MWIVSEKSSEFKEKLFKSEFEANYSPIFLTYLVSIRYVIAFYFNKLGYWWDYKCLTTSKWDTRKINKFTTSARDLRIILFILIYILFCIKKGYNTSIDLVINIKIMYLYLILFLRLVFSSPPPRWTTYTIYTNNSLYCRSNYFNKHDKRGKRLYSTGIPNK